MKFVQYFSKHPKQKKTILFLASFCVLVSFVGYMSLLLYLLIQKNIHDFLFSFFIPLGTILLVEVIRHFYSRPRPFETGYFELLIDHSKGKSFPSKHATSAMIIALSIYQVNSLLGSLMIINALMVGLTRIFTGIHHVSDVLGGYLLALLLSLFYLL